MFPRSLRKRERTRLLFFPVWGKLLAFLLLFEAVSKGEPVHVVYWKATRFAFRFLREFSPSGFFGEF